MKKWIIRQLAGSKMGEAYTAFALFLVGKKTYLVGGAMVLQGLAQIVAVIASSSDLGAILEVINNPQTQEGLQKLTEGFGLMTLRAGIAKAGK